MELSSETHCPSSNGLVVMADDRVPQTQVFLSLCDSLERQSNGAMESNCHREEWGKLGRCLVAMRNSQLTPFTPGQVLELLLRCKFFSDDNPVGAL